MKKYSEITVEVYGFEHCLAYQDENGILTDDDIWKWEGEDRGNREIYFMIDKEEAKEFAKELKEQEYER